MRQWNGWSYRLNENGKPQRFKLEKGFKYRFNADMGRNASIQVVNDYGESHVRLDNNTDGDISLYDDFVADGQEMIVLFVGEVEDYYFEMIGVSL